MGATVPLRKPYRPSNGTEGEMFYEAWCGRCHRDKAFREGGRGCSILCATLIYPADSPYYPVEWVEDEKDGARCTAFAPLDGPAPGRDAALKAWHTRRLARATGDLFRQ
jgi:hypothetical protein